MTGNPGPTTPAAGTPKVVGARSFASVFRPYRRDFLHGTAWLLCTNAAALWLPSLLNQGVESLRAGTPWRALLPHAALMAGLAAVAAFTRVLSRVLVFSVGRDVEFDLRRDLYVLLSLQPPAFFQQRPTGDLMSRASNDLSNVRLLFGFALLNIINTLMVIGGNVPLMFRLDAVLAMAALAPYPLVFLSAQVVAKKVFAYTRQNQEDLGKVSNRVQEHLAGLSVVRAFAQEDAQQRRFEEANDNYYRSAVRMALFRNLLQPLMGFLGATCALVALWFGAYRVLGGHLSVGGLVEFVGRLTSMMWPVLSLGWVMAVWQRGQASFTRLNEVMTVTPSILTPDAPVEPQRTGAARLEGVGLFRPAAKKDAAGSWSVQDVDLNLPARGFVGLAGGTGSGKSTLTWLIPRMLDPTQGTVTVDGVDVKRQALGALRRQVAVAPQEPFLFSMSLLDNLRFGRPEATREEVDAVVRLMGLETDVKAFPQGLDTTVGERGITLSGGQRQRVALGRALLTDPRVLVLDDTLSALDAETEERILRALRSEAARRTLLVVSHRLAILKDADEVLVMDGGRVVERGTHAQLVAAGGKYAALWGRQRALEELDRLDAQPGMTA